MYAHLPPIIACCNVTHTCKEHVLRQQVEHARKPNSRAGHAPNPTVLCLHFPCQYYPSSIVGHVCQNSAASPSLAFATVRRNVCLLSLGECQDSDSCYCWTKHPSESLPKGAGKGSFAEFHCSSLRREKGYVLNHHALSVCILIAS